MTQIVQQAKKKKIKFGTEKVKKAFMNTKLTELYNKLNIVSLTIVPSVDKDVFDLIYVYEGKR